MAAAAAEVALVDLSWGMTSDSIWRLISKRASLVEKKRSAFVTWRLVTLAREMESSPAARLVPVPHVEVVV